MPARDIIVIGASAGGIEPLKQLVSALPPDLPAALFVVVHSPAKSIGVLPQILNRARAARYPSRRRRFPSCAHRLSRLHERATGR